MKKKVTNTYILLELTLILFCGMAGLCHSRWLRGSAFEFAGMAKSGFNLLYETVKQKTKQKLKKNKTRKPAYIPIFIIHVYEYLLCARDWGKEECTVVSQTKVLLLPSLQSTGGDRKQIITS